MTSRVNGNIENSVFVSLRSLNGREHVIPRKEWTRSFFLKRRWSCPRSFSKSLRNQHTINHSDVHTGGLCRCHGLGDALGDGLGDDLGRSVDDHGTTSVMTSAMASVTASVMTSVMTSVVRWTTDERPTS